MGFALRLLRSLCTLGCETAVTFSSPMLSPHLQPGLAIVP